MTVSSGASRAVASQKQRDVRPRELRHVGEVERAEGRHALPVLAYSCSKGLSTLHSDCGCRPQVT